MPSCRGAGATQVVIFSFMALQKSRRKKQKKTSVQDLQPDAIPSPAKLESMPAEDRLESSAVLLLVSLFVAIIGQGLFLAVSVRPSLHACSTVGFNMTCTVHLPQRYTRIVCFAGFPARELGSIRPECGVQDILANSGHLSGLLCCIWGVEGED